MVRIGGKGMTEEIINSDGSRNWQANILLDNIKRLEQENKELKELKCKFKEYCTCDTERYRSALEEIRGIAKFNQFYNPEDLLINGDIGQIQDLKMTEIYNRINEVLNESK